MNVLATWRSAWHIPLIAVAVWAAGAPAWAGTRLFLVAAGPGYETHFDSYVLPLSDPAAIAHARDLIEQGPAIGQALVVARIAAGADGINRDWLGQGAPEWSWHVTEFLGFGDATPEIYDGSPTLVESDVAGWIENTGGVIGFWSYTVVAELGTEGKARPPEANGEAPLARDGKAR